MRGKARRRSPTPVDPTAARELYEPPLLRSKRAYRHASFNSLGLCRNRLNLDLPAGILPVGQLRDRLR